MSAPHFRVAIAGSGFGGIGTAIRLKRAGVDSLVVFERAHDVGGVWRDNTYPGCACDVQSHLYSFSFAPNPKWSRAYSSQPEILEYLRDCAARFDVLRHVRFGHEVQDASWDARAKRWKITTSQGPFTADVLVAGVGALSEPKIPKLEGIERFQGKAFHSARWDHAHDLRGKDVAVVGTGASAIQFVPAIQPLPKKLTVYQRTPPWIIPRFDRPIRELERKMFAAVPASQWLARAGIYVTREMLLGPGFFWPKLMELNEKVAKQHLENQVPDPELRKKLTPNYVIGCKRILLSDDYLPALTKPNVEVVTDGIREVRADSIVTSDGRERPVDTIIFGTGFHVTDPPIAKRVRGARGETLQESWRGSPKAYMGTTIAGFPNFFLLFGPNTGLGHTSVVTMLESQIEHVANAVQFLTESGASSVEPSEAAQARWVREIDEKMRGTVWNSGGCKSWYIDDTGRNSTLWPGFTFTFKRRIERFDPKDHVIDRAPRVDVAATNGAAREHA